MGFVVRKGRSEHVPFYLLEEVWDSDSKVSKQKSVPKTSYIALGFRLDMTVEEARARAKQINKQTQIESKKQIAIARRVEHDAAVESAYLPKHLVTEFESELRQNYDDNPERLSNLLKQWSVVQKMIANLELDTRKFHDERARFFNYFRDQAWGTDYIKKLTRMTNQWGEFVARKRDQSYRALPPLTDTQKERIIDIRDGIKGIKTAADPLSWSDLRAQKTPFANNALVLQWNWMFIALWFGLRPKEVDGLKSQKNWRIELDAESKTEVLYVYQSKLRGVPKDQRWKPIPIFTREQREARALIEAGEFKRPLNKTLRRFFEDKIECYSPRKGFTDLLLGYGFALEDISIFLGHRDISMTWKHYKSKRSFKLPRKAS